MFIFIIIIHFFTPSVIITHRKSTVHQTYADT